MSLKELTSEKHKEAERMPFNVRMINGELSKREYLHYLIQQASIFQIIEQKGVPHKSLLRLTRVFEDIEELLPDVGSDVLPVLKSMETYGKYLQKLEYGDLLPHIYLHYLALMYGGQMIKSKVFGSGRMYDFDDMKSAAHSIRDLIVDAWVDEVNTGFQFMIDIFDELERIHNPTK
jgi:heme oxygenase